MTYATLTTAPDVLTVVHKRPKLKDLQEVVGGYVETINLERDWLGEEIGDAIMWVNEDGIRLGLPLNPIASALARRPILGDVAFTGPADASGVETNVPEPLLGMIRKVLPPEE